MTNQVYSASYAQDRAEIEDLLARYLFALDWNDFETFGETFTEDATFEYARGTASGRDAIVATIRGFKERIGTLYTDDKGNPAILRHVLGQTVIRMEGERAWTTAFWWEMANNGPGNSPLIGTFGIYEDELRKDNGAWKFSRRRVLNEFLEGRQSSVENPVLAMDAIASA
ncbi:nuclear transport factor 2 family protein [Aurantiacibacter xanthus]|uniref:nuclear transport factor 2 family protein n=1 Tax=Aurantiacibacter xanthus TaxID=1784712 RepID=UPI00174BF9AA|nr:nuclear transport factor 2 family protein [Aurantiacibacter xanthus]